MINIMEDEASPVEILERFLEADIEESRPVELVRIRLVDDIHPVVYILPC